ncbi:hypothetical protein AB0M46_34795 [Dactylosporangium sp. NPDC051485]|uniref:hypothetical protein n=1 Tax=Dactylosporangium sp. NPDC051485 TaxID=3154846 RepID=UPI003444268B
MSPIPSGVSDNCSTRRCGNAVASAPFARVVNQSDSCQHEHPFIRCPLLRVDPAQRPQLQEIRDNLTARILEAEQHGWLGEAEGLRVSLAAAQAKLAHLDERTQRGTIDLGIPNLQRKRQP